MGPIQPVDTTVSGAQHTPVTQPAQANPAQAASTTPSASAPSVSMVSSVNTTAIYSHVDTMLAAVGGGVQDNQLLRMIIGLLILQVLMGVDGGNQQTGAGALLGMLGLAGADRQTQAATLHSATNVVQIEQQSTLLTTSQAVLSPTATEGDPNDPGSQVDLEA